MTNFVTNYMAYGSNLNQTQMKDRCPESKILGTYILPDYRLLFKRAKSKYFATIEEAPGFIVPTAIYSLTQENEDRLDIQEGANLKKPSYTKEYFNLSVTSRTLCYIMAKTTNIGLPSPEYLMKLISGYKHFGFDLDILIEAYEYSKAQEFQQLVGKMNDCDRVVKSLK